MEKHIAVFKAVTKTRVIKNVETWLAATVKEHASKFDTFNIINKTYEVIDGEHVIEIQYESNAGIWKSDGTAKKIPSLKDTLKALISDAAKSDGPCKIDVGDKITIIKS